MKNKETLDQKLENICIQTGLPCGMQCLSEEACNSIRLKQETLEEAAEIYADENAKDENISYHNLYTPLEYTFRSGAKWQAERMYSEEEVLQILMKTDRFLKADLDIWFQHFKKK